MYRYVNTTDREFTIQGVTFKPGEVHEVPNPINYSRFYHTDLPCTTNLTVKESTPVDSIDINPPVIPASISNSKKKHKNRSEVKSADKPVDIINDTTEEETNGTNNDQ